MKKLRLQAIARDEMAQAYDWHEDNGGRGKLFLRAVKSTFERIRRMPRIHRVVKGDVRRAVVERYPYCVYYREAVDAVEVVSVFHTSRDPANWLDRV